MPIGSRKTDSLAMGGQSAVERDEFRSLSIDFGHGNARARG